MGEFMKTYTKEKNTTLLLHEDSHRNWHYLFGNKTLDEIIALLQRIKQIKIYNHDTDSFNTTLNNDVIIK